MKLSGEKVLVVGMKRSGVASAKLLLRGGAAVRTTDLKPLSELPEAAALGIPSAQQTPEVFEGCDLIVLSPDVPADRVKALRQARAAWAEVRRQTRADDHHSARPGP